MTTLYLRPGACSLATHIILEEIGADYDTVEVDLASKRTASGDDYLAVNPKGQVPSLVLEDGQLLTEGPAILQYLADTSGRTDLLPPAGDMARYRVLEWLNFIATELHKSISPLMRPDTPADYREVALTHVRKRFLEIDSHLQDRTSLTESDFTIADAYLLVIASWMGRLGIDAVSYPSLSAFRERHGVRRSVIAARSAEGLP